MSSSKRKKKSKTNTKISSSSSSTSSSQSPDIKKQKNQDEQEEDEVFAALDMAAEVASQLKDITTKLDKLNDIETKIDNLTTSVRSLELKIFKLDRQVEDLRGKYNQIDQGLNDLNMDVEELKQWKSQVEDDRYDSDRDIRNELDTLKQELLYAEAYSRRENLKFIGIDEEDGENTREVLLNFLDKELGLANAQKIEFQRVHRNGKNTPRTIIARFLRYSDCERILSLGKNLKGKPFTIYQDYPTQILDRRKKAMGALKEARKRGKKAAFSKTYPDKLYIDGELYIPGFSSVYTETPYQR